MRRTERLFALAEHLRARRSGITAEALAERFDVSLRTIYRDLDSLRAAALPLQAERGRGGGYALDRSYSLPPVNFTAREAALLLVAGRFLSEMRILPFSVAVDRALDKVRAALPAGGQRDLSGQGQFSLNGTQLTWTPVSPVPEPASLVAGLLIFAGLSRRSRKTQLVR